MGWDGGGGFIPWNVDIAAKVIAEDSRSLVACIFNSHLLFFHMEIISV